MANFYRFWFMDRPLLLGLVIVGISILLILAVVFGCVLMSYICCEDANISHIFILLVCVFLIFFLVGDHFCNEAKDAYVAEEMQKKENIRLKMISNYEANGYVCVLSEDEDISNETGYQILKDKTYRDFIVDNDLKKIIIFY